jgi:hypothetical protein
MDPKISEQYRKTLDLYLGSVSKAFGDVGHKSAAPHLKEYLIASTANGLQLLAASVAKALSDVSEAGKLEAGFNKFLKDSHSRVQSFKEGSSR